MVYASFDLLLRIVMELFWRKLIRVLMHLAMASKRARFQAPQVAIAELLGLPASPTAYAGSRVMASSQSRQRLESSSGRAATFRAMV